MDTVKNAFRTIFAIRWRPNRDLVAVLISVVLVTGSLYTATFIITPEAGGGLGYFFMYAGVTALLFGVVIPLLWMVVYRKRSLSDLGITKKHLGISILLQLVFFVIQFSLTLAKADLPPLGKTLPLIALAITIGFFEAFFWRGWVLLRLEEAFGVLPAILLGSALYAAYHIGYGMPLSEMLFLFWIGVLYAVCFRLTRNLFILWPLFQPAGQLVTLIRDELSLPTIASVGFLEAFIVMLLAVWFAQKFHLKKKKQSMVSTS